jgi:hypothetical protein
MRITCFNCRHTWDVSTGQLFAARLKNRLGFKEHAFVCPNCDAQSVVTEADFVTSVRM